MRAEFPENPVPVQYQENRIPSIRSADRHELVDATDTHHFGALYAIRSDDVPKVADDSRRLGTISRFSRLGRWCYRRHYREGKGQRQQHETVPLAECCCVL